MELKGELDNHARLSELPYTYNTQRYLGLLENILKANDITYQG